MEISDFKKSLLGYKKQDVIEYISQLNQSFDETQKESKAEYARIQSELNLKNEQMNAKVVELENDIYFLKKELEESKAQTEALRAYADELEDAMHQNRDVEKEKLAVNQKLADYEKQVAQIKESAMTELEGAHGQIEKVKNRISNL